MSSRNRSGLRWRRRSDRAGGSNEGNKYERRRKSWAELAAETGGTLGSGRRATDPLLTYGYDAWTIRADTHTTSNGQSSVTHTRVRARYRAVGDFRLTIRPANPFTRILARLGLPDVKTGDATLDHRYLVQGDGVGRVRSFFMDGRIRALLRSPERFRIELRRPPRKDRRRHGDHIREVRIQVVGGFLPIERVRDLLRLCEATLDRLASFGAASRDPAP